MNDPFQNPYLNTGEASDDQGQGVIVGGTLTGFIKVGQLISIALAAGLVFMALVIAYMTISSADGQQPAGLRRKYFSNTLIPSCRCQRTRASPPW